MAQRYHLTTNSIGTSNNQTTFSELIVIIKAKPRSSQILHKSSKECRKLLKKKNEHFISFTFKESANVVRFLTKSEKFSNDFALIFQRNGYFKSLRRKN